MQRNTVVNVLLIIAGIVLAIALFAAGAFWKGNSSPKRATQIPWPDQLLNPAARLRMTVSGFASPRA